MSKKKPSYLERRKQDHVNKKAILWTSGAVIVFIVLMTVLLIINR
jgi:hypothetical protein